MPTRLRKLFFGIAVIGFFGVPASGPAAAEITEIVIGTGAPGGVFHRIGRAVCRLVNRKTEGLKCTARPAEAGDTSESMANLIHVENGAIEIGLVRSDWLYHAVNGSGPVAFLDANFDRLRTLFAVPGETFTIVARRDASIHRLDDLAGKRVNIGDAGSRQRALMDEVMTAQGWTRADFLLGEELPEAEQSLALCHDRVQAVVYAVAHPDRAIKRITRLCDATLVDVSGAAIDGLIADKPYYAPITVPAGTYAGTPNAVRGFGTSVVLVSSTDVDPTIVRAVVAAVFDDLDAFKRMNTTFATLEAKTMIRRAMTAPLHDGAAAYFRTDGLM